jgi:hypothetical protein
MREAHRDARGEHRDARGEHRDARRAYRDTRGTAGQHGARSGDTIAIVREAADREGR